MVQLCVDRVTGEQVAIKFLERGDKVRIAAGTHKLSAAPGQAVARQAP